MARLLFCLMLVCSAMAFVGCSASQPKSGGGETKRKAPAQQQKSLQQLVSDMSSSDVATSEAALKSIRGMGKDAVPELMRMLGDPNPATRRNAVVALGEVGPPAADVAMEKLREMAEKDPDEGVRKAAANSVKQIETRF